MRKTWQRSWTRMKTKKSPALDQQKQILKFKPSKVLESQYKHECLCILNFIATKALLCCALVKSHCSKVNMWLQAEFRARYQLSSAAAEVTEPSDGYRSASGNRFPNGQHKKSSQILNNPVLDMEIFALQPSEYWMSNSPTGKLPGILEGTLQKSLCTFQSKSQDAKSSEFRKYLKRDIDSRAT